MLERMLLLMLSCAPSTGDSTTGDPTTGDSAASQTCEALLTGDPPTTAADITAIISVVRGAYFSELEGVSIELGTLDSDDSFFVANLDLSTLDVQPLERDYLVLYNPVLLSDPPPYAGVGAILVHEIKHILDYTAMDTTELVEFGLWYASGDVAEYERQTDEFALEAGCGPGLIAYREWLYDHISEEDAAQKRIDYYTSEEISAWMAAHE